MLLSECAKRVSLLLLFFNSVYTQDIEPNVIAAIVGVNKTAYRVPSLRNVTLSCRVSNIPMGTIVQHDWLHNMIPIGNLTIPIGAMFNLTENKLFISSFSNLLHPGKYQCRVTTRDTSHYESNVLTLYPNSISVYPANRTVWVIEGESIELECIVVHPPDEQILIKWRKKDTDRVIMDAYSGATVLHVDNVSRDDAGIYECVVAGNSAGNGDAEIQLNVIVSPIFAVSHRHEEGLTGKELNITCGPVHSTFPVQPIVSIQSIVPVHFDWLFNGVQLVPSSRVQIIHSADRAMLLLKQLTYHDQGNYSCVASNPAGDSLQHIIINVTGPPQLTISSEISLHIQVNQTKLFECPFIAHPKAIVTRWIRGQETLQPSNKYMIFENGSLLISYLNSSDSGNYTCEVKNSIGTDSAVYDLLVIDIPEQPTDLMATIQQDNKNSAVLSWTAPIDVASRPVESYIIVLRCQGHIISKLVLPHNTTSMVLTRLLPGENHSITIQSSNQAGLSSFSTIMLSVPVAAPALSFCLKALLDGRSFQAVWELLYDGGPDVSTFTIRVYTIKTSKVLVHSLSPNINDDEVVVEGLEPTTEYAVEVTISNGLMENSTEFSINTTEAPPSQPSTPRITLITTHIIKITFTVEVGSQPITHLILCTKKEGESTPMFTKIAVSDPLYVDSIEEFEEGKELKVTLVVSGLQSEQKYTFKVAAISSVGLSKFSHPTDPVNLDDGHILYIVSGVVGGTLFAVMTISGVIMLLICRKRHIQKSKRTISINSGCVTEMVKSFGLQSPPQNRRQMSKSSPQSPNLNLASLPDTPTLVLSDHTHQVLSTNTKRMGAISPPYDKLSDCQKENESFSDIKNKNGSESCSSEGNQDMPDNDIYSSIGKIEQCQLSVLSLHPYNQLWTNNQLSVSVGDFNIKQQNSLNQETTHMHAKSDFLNRTVNTSLISGRYSSDSMLGAVQPSNYMTDV